MRRAGVLFAVVVAVMALFAPGASASTTGVIYTDFAGGCLVRSTSSLFQVGIDDCDPMDGDRTWRRVPTTSFTDIQLVNNGSNECLAPQFSPTGTLRLQLCSSVGSQRWDVVLDANGNHQLIHRQSGWCVAADGTFGPVNRVCDGGFAQDWFVSLW